jgi:Ricin-type beta-trefoil lectin domain
MKLRSIVSIAAVLVAGATGVMIPSPAQAAAYYQVVNRQWDQCLSVEGGSTQHAADVIAERCDAAPQRLWTKVPAEKVGNVQYFYLKVQHTDMCLNVAYYGQADGDDVVQATCSGSVNEQWAFSDLKDTGHQLLTVRHSGKCLDKAWAGDVVQWRCHGGVDNWWQQWRLAYISG